MIGEVLVIVGDEVRADIGTYSKSDFKKGLRVGAFFDDETMKIVPRKPPAEECPV